MLGVWVNAIAVFAGGVIGSRLRGGIPKRLSDSINTGLGLCVLLIGISGAIKTQNIMLVIISIVLGTVIGELIRIEDRLERLGAWAQKKLARNDDGFSKGFINATLLFCVGSMAIVGSLEAGFQNKADTLLAKSILDGVSALIFASSWGMGVVLSIVPLTIYQGGIALLAMGLGNFLSDAAILEMSATGSLLIIGLSLNMLGTTKERVRVGNMLPAMLIPAVYITLRALL